MVALEAGMQVDERRYSLRFAAMNYMAEELQKQLQRHAHPTSLLASGSTQLSLPCGSSTRSGSFVGKRLDGCGLRQPESGTFHSEPRG
jgi:hypothetical protein